jgi:HPt (histidine-containing phosphotransfer) domain-containing protein
VQFTHQNTHGQDPAFDPEAVLDSLEGDSGLLLEIVGISLVQFPKHMEKIRESIRKADSKTLERAAHALKGAAGNLLARRVREVSLILEEMGGAGSLEGAEEALVTLEEELERLQLELMEFEKEHSRHD